MNRLKKKLNSDRGASITYALLIFLVCAVVGSAVLVAGTAASGRMAKVTEYDQRYYAVNSAARLLIDMIDDVSVEIIKEEDSKANPKMKYYYLDSDRNRNAFSESPTSFASVPVRTAYMLITGTSSFAYTVSAEAGKETIPSVAVDEEIDSANNSLTLTVKSDPENSKYSLRLTFNLDRSDVSDVLEKDDKGNPTKTETTSILAWHLRDIQVVGSQRWVD